MEEYKRLKDPYSRYGISINVEVKNLETGKMMATNVINSGYKAVQLTINNRGTKLLIHRLVAETYIPNPNNLPYVNHIDHNKFNNHISNLEWCTHTENNRAARKLGIYHDTHIIRLVDLYFLEERICRSMQEVTDLTGIKTDIIFRIVRGKRHGHVGRWWIELSQDQNYLDKSWWN